MDLGPCSLKGWSNPEGLLHQEVPSTLETLARQQKHLVSRYSRVSFWHDLIKIARCRLKLSKIDQSRATTDWIFTGRGTSKCNSQILPEISWAELSIFWLLSLEHATVSCSSITRKIISEFNSFSITLTLVNCFRMNVRMCKGCVSLCPLTHLCLWSDLRLHDTYTLDFI